MPGSSIIEKAEGGLSDEEAKKVLSSLDPRLLEQIIELQRQGVVSDKDEVVSSVSGYHTSSSHNLDLPEDLLATTGPASPSLKRVSVSSMETKSGVFHKKKSIPSLVLTFDAANRFINNAKENQKEDDDQETISSITKPSSVNKLLSVDSVLDKMETASMVSHKSYRSGMNQSVFSNNSSTDVTEKKQRFWDFLTMVLSISYGIGIIMLSLVCYASDLIVSGASEVHPTEIWNLTLSSIGIVLLIFLTVDIEKYIRTINKMSMGNQMGAEFKLVEGPDGEFHVEIPMDNKERKKIPEYYGFTTGRHAGSFFLKIGAALFCFGHLIHMGLNFVKTLYMKNISIEFYRNICSNDEKLVHDIVYPVFSLIQLFFVFKYGNVIVNKNKWLARFTFMHCACSSLSFWINSVVQETLDSLVKKYYKVTSLDSECKPADQYSNTSSTTEAAITTQSPVFYAEKLPDCQTNASISDISNNVICVLETRARCNYEVEQTEELFTINPWFYPFSIEFSILIVAIWYILWSSIGKIDQHKNSLEFLPSSVTPQGSLEDLHRTAGHKEAQIIFADCSSSNTGLFTAAGVMVVVIVVSIFVLVREGSCDPDLAITVGNWLQITVIFILILATIYAYMVIAQFDVNPHPISFLDDMLLFFCLPSFFLYAFLCLGPSVFYNFQAEFFFRNFLIMIQVLIQTPMIVDGLRRCSNTIQAQRQMRGRNAITFLIVTNLTVYIMETLLIRSYDYQAVKIEFYGPDVWTVLSHMTLPICIFYRFHSAVALVDIWTSAYKSEHAH